MWLTAIGFIVSMVWCLCLCASCTINVEHVSNDGTARDLLDETQEIKPDIETKIPINQPCD